VDIRNTATTVPTRSSNDTATEYPLPRRYKRRLMATPGLPIRAEKLPVWPG
jgi:hypothetical protein